YGGALAAGSLAVARAALPDRSPRSLHIQMVRAVPRGAARATAEVLHAGRTVGTVEVRLFDHRDKLAATSLVTMVNPDAVASELHDIRPTPAFETNEFEFDGPTDGPWISPIVHALTLGLRDGDGQIGRTALEVVNLRTSVDGTAAVANLCILPWDDLECTGPEAACLMADTMVGYPILRSWIPVEALGPNPDLTLRFTTAPATRQLVGASMVLCAPHGTATIGIEVQAGQ